MGGRIRTGNLPYKFFIPVFGFYMPVTCMYLGALCIYVLRNRIFLFEKLESQIWNHPPLHFMFSE